MTIGNAALMPNQSSQNVNKQRAFSLVELLVVIGVIGILAALLSPSLGRAKEKAKRTACINHLRQVNFAIRLYGDDHADSLPVLPQPNPYPNGVGAYYKQLVKSYVGLVGPASPEEKVFICPTDRTMHTQVKHAFTSYTFNGYEIGADDIARITGQRLSAIRNPAKAVLVGEWTAFFGGSWHPFVNENYPDARNGLGFVDGHVSFAKIYWDAASHLEPRNCEPPAGYEYSWSGE
ncbi:MAG: type II secretion system protein [Verrucomicrobiota bacterium]